MEQKVTFVASNFQDFLQYKKDNPDVQCEQIIDTKTLESRFPGPIVVMSSIEKAWNYVGIMESIDRFQAKHTDYFERLEGREEQEELDLTDEDLQLGI